MLSLQKFYFTKIIGSDQIFPTIKIILKNLDVSIKR